MKVIRNRFLYELLDKILSLTGLSFSSKQCKQFLESAQNQKFDAIIVPGIPYNGKKFNKIMIGRVYWAHHLFEKGIAKNIIFSGAAVHSPFVESEIMAYYANYIGVPKENILIENKAEHSTENVLFSYNMAQNAGFKTVALVSDPFQSRLLRKYVYKNISSEITLIPIVYNVLKEIESNMIIPPINNSDFQIKDFTALSDRESFPKRFKGTLGKNISPNKTNNHNS